MNHWHRNEIIGQNNNKMEQVNRQNLHRETTIFSAVKFMNNI